MGTSSRHAITCCYYSIQKATLGKEKNRIEALHAEAVTCILPFARRTKMEILEEY